MKDYALLRTLLSPFGELRSQSASDWSGNMPLHPDVVCFYEEVGPWGCVYHESVGPVGSTLVVGGNPVCIPPLYKLCNLQAGYAWSHNAEAKLPGWNENWLVIAEQGGDPFILDQSCGQVLFAFHGAGSWRPKFFAENLFQAFGALATVATTFISLDDNAFVDCEITKAALSVIESQLSDFLGSRTKAEGMLKVWEYS